MAAALLPASRFIRKTRLGANEYRKNFQQIDREIITAITSLEADEVTPLMSKIYLRLVSAPDQYWECEGVLRIKAEIREGKLVKAWAVLCELAGAASATASKAMRWMHEQGIIGYFSGKNGVGLRIFLNRAASSIGVRKYPEGKKILTFPPASSGELHASANEPAFNDSYADSEVLDSDVNSRAPKNGADKVQVDKIFSEPDRHPPTDRRVNRGLCTTTSQASSAASLEEIVTRLRNELEPLMQTATRNAAAREHERTREWLESRGLPKAARVAQHEAYNILRQHGLITNNARTAHADVGRGSIVQADARPLTPEEIRELAETCVALLEVHGQAIDVTLAELSAEAGGTLLPVDAPKVRKLAEAMIEGEGRE